MAEIRNKIHPEYQVVQQVDVTGNLNEPPLHRSEPTMPTQIISNMQLSFWSFSALVSLGIMTYFVFPASVESTMPIQLSTPNAQPISTIKTGNVKPQPATEVPSIPESNSGVTIIAGARVSDYQKLNSSPDAPISQEALAANGFAVSLGEAQSFVTLSKRFAEVSRVNGGMFLTLEPRAFFIDTAAGLSARLVTGPFENEADAKEFCGIITLPDDIVCQTQAFEGELIARQ